MTETNGTVTSGETDGVKKHLPGRGKRYSPAIKEEILGFALDKDVSSATVKYGVTETSIYEWRKAAKRRGNETGNFPEVQTEEEDSKVDRDRLILAMWRQHPG
ncbi:MAG: transposase, partial [Deltaproteobacteria bacterium]